MVNKNTSRVFDTWDALYELLVAQPWTAHERTNLLPDVWFGDIDEPKIEAVIVVGVPPDAPDLNIVTVGSSSSTEEEFTLRIMIGTKVAGCDRDIVRQRLAELCDVVQNALRSSTTGRPAGDFNSTVPGVLWWRILRLAPTIYSMETGFAGYAELDYLFHAHI